jgi:hypothetical protein
MITLTYGVLPELSVIEQNFPDNGYDIECHATSLDFESISNAIYQQIDSHLEAIFFKQNPGEYGKQKFVINDAKSLHCLIRRLIESDNDNSLDLASSILFTLDIEWV